jgi:hypothetical protein
MPEVGYFTSNVKAFEIQRPEQILNVSFVDTNKNMTVHPQLYALHKVMVVSSMASPNGLLLA